MGGYFFANITAWTFLCLCTAVPSSVASADPDHGLLQDLGLDSLPDVTKINISQDEYSNMMHSYLNSLRDSSSDADAVPKLITLKSEKKYWRRRNKWNDSIRVRVPIRRGDENSEVESAELRLLAAPIPGLKTVQVKVFQILGARRRRLVRDVDVYFSPNSAKWYDFDVTSAVQAWLSGERNLGLELDCPECRGGLQLLEVGITALVHPNNPNRRIRRSSPHQYYSPDRRTDCKDNDKKKRCCRHTMKVTFKDLKLPQMQSIIQPKFYDAGFCRGRCPLNYNHATNHSRIQSLVHRLDQKATPRVCCAPSKLKSLDILRVNPADATKLIVEKWDNMMVLECACS